MRNVNAKKNQEVLSKSGQILVGYFTAGYPDRVSFLDVLVRCEKAGMDIFEIGYPSKDPSSDGEVIQQAHKKIDHSIATDLQFWLAVRSVIESPIWLMAYKKDILENDFYIELSEKKLIDAIVIPDMTYQERAQLQEALDPYGVDVVGFIGPGMDEMELKLTLNNQALIYQQLYAGPTGMANTSDDYERLLKQAKKHKHIKVFAGFGISTPERVEELLGKGFDGTIIGTEIIRKLNSSIDDLIGFVKSIKDVNGEEA